MAAALLAGAGLVVAGCAGSTPARRDTAAGLTHPEVDADLEGCAGCHEQATPAVAAQWRDGRHGMGLVQCFVCHGSTGADFKARPEPTTCRSCHPAEWASVVRDGQARSCFGCHQPHALAAQGKTSPHLASTAKESRP